MNNVCRDIFRSIHEGMWLAVEYENLKNTHTKYWIAIHDINLEKKSLEVTGFHLRTYASKNLTLFIGKILSAKIIEGTYYKVNAALNEDIEAFPQKYAALFSGAVNLRVLNYLCDCNKLSDLPKLNTKYSLIEKLDSSKLENRIYRLSDEQFKTTVNSFREKTSQKKHCSPIVQLALNILSVHTKKGLYVLAYREVRFDVEKRMLIAENKINICHEFCVAKNEGGKNIKLSIQNFLDAEELNLLDDFEKNAEAIKDVITQNLKSGNSVDDCPYFLCLERDMNINLENEYKAIEAMYDEQNVTVPIRAFFGELHSVKTEDEILPLALIDKNVNLDQMLAIHNALNCPVAYIQGPPGTGKTTTILNTIITAFFNSKTVLFSSYNNHPIDGVFEKLSNLKYKNYTIPFPVLRIANNERIPKTCTHIKRLLESIQNLNVYDAVLQQNKEMQIAKNKKAERTSPKARNANRLSRAQRVD